MPQAIQEKSSHWTSAFREVHEHANRRVPSWIERMRESALAHFESVGFPTVDQEDWKYTNVAPLAKREFVPASSPHTGELSAETLQPFAYAESSQSRLVFVNGTYRAELSALNALPDGVIVADLADAFTGEHQHVA